MILVQRAENHSWLPVPGWPDPTRQIRRTRYRDIPGCIYELRGGSDADTSIAPSTDDQRRSSSYRSRLELARLLARRSRTTPSTATGCVQPAVNTLTTRCLRYLDITRYANASRVNPFKWSENYRPPPKIFRLITSHCCAIW